MKPTRIFLAQGCLLAILALACARMQSDAALGGLQTLPRRMQAFPRITLWAWERTEDLRSINPATTALACLDRTILIGPQRILVEPRMHPLLYPAGVTRIAVVRVEVRSGASLDAGVEASLLPILLEVSRQPGIAALQIDFDATRSQRSFYRRLLLDLRRQLPPSLPLSITALASWCSYDDWLAKLPVDEAVPMLFRMEPDRRRTRLDDPATAIREPLCQGSLGLSTHERWAYESGSNLRIYLFPDRGWKTDLPLLNSRMPALEALAITGQRFTP